MKILSRVTDIEYAIRAYMNVAKELENAGKRIIYLNIGDPLRFDFKTPQIFVEALKEVVDGGYGYYAPSQGIPELIEAIRDLENEKGVKLENKNILVTQGVSEGIQFALGALTNPGDKILVPGPTYPPYINIAKFLGVVPVEYKCFSKNWQPDIDDIRNKIDNETKAIVIINPNNPTGALYNKKVLKGIIDVALEHDLLIISDEIYDRIVYDDMLRPTASLVKDGLVIGLNGFSKSYLLTGWRLGYVYVYDPTHETEDEIMKLLLKMAMLRLSVNTPIQVAVARALRSKERDSHIKPMKKKLVERRDYSVKRLREIGMDVVKPEGAFYVFPKVPEGNWKDDKDFMLRLLKEKGVFVVHGSGFGEYGKGYFRMVYLPPVEILEEAFEKVKSFVRENV